jgi:hypothetical protein
VFAAELDKRRQEDFLALFMIDVGVLSHGPVPQGHAGIVATQ